MLLLLLLMLLLLVTDVDTDVTTTSTSQCYHFYESILPLTSINCCKRHSLTFAAAVSCDHTNTITCHTHNDRLIWRSVHRRE
jgi:hypothetical protein